MTALDAAREMGRGLPGPAVAAFTRYAEARFGLAAGRWNALALRKRLLDLMARAALPDEPPQTFLARLEAAEVGSALHQAAADVLPNGETSFFRDAAQLREVSARLVPEAAARNGGEGGRAVRVLSVGCSTGEEVYSLAMLLFEASFTRFGAQVELTGVDLRARAIEQAKRGAYPAADLRAGREAPAGWARRFFRQDGEDLAVARPFLRQLCRFQEGDLLRPTTLAHLGAFDVVVCRNVLIHFERAAAQAAVRALRALLRPGGALVLSHAEAPFARPEPMEAAG